MAASTTSRQSTFRNACCAVESRQHREAGYRLRSLFAAGKPARLRSQVVLAVRLPSVPLLIIWRRHNTLALLFPSCNQLGTSFFHPMSSNVSVSGGVPAATHRSHGESREHESTRCRARAPGPGASFCPTAWARACTVQLMILRLWLVDLRKHVPVQRKREREIRGVL
jgi:hypothetical protein